MASSESKPVVLLVTGAWHPPKCYASLQSSLSSLGYECVIPQMPSMGADKNGITWKADTAKIVETATPYFDAGREVVLLAHSYGGVPAGAATEGQGVEQRAADGKKGGFSHIVFLAAFAIPVKGWDLLTTFGGKWPEWQDTAEPYTKNHCSNLNAKAKDMLYTDCSPEEAEKVLGLTVPHSQDAFETGCEFIASDITIPKTYVICETDGVFPLFLQEQLVQATPGMKEARLNAGHSPFRGKAEETAKLLQEVFEGKA